MRFFSQIVAQNR